MKILVLNGSPRPNGNTAKMVGVFREAAEKNGHEVVCFNVCKMNTRALSFSVTVFTGKTAFYIQLTDIYRFHGMI